MSKETRKPIAYVEAVVRFPLYDGDTRNSSWDWFEYAEPGFTADGEIGVCRRPVKVVSSKIIEEPNG